MAHGGCRLVVLVPHPHVGGLRRCVISTLSQVEMFDVAAVLKTVHFVFCVLCFRYRIKIDYEEERREGVDGMHLVQGRVNKMRNVGCSSLVCDCQLFN